MDTTKPNWPVRQGRVRMLAVDTPENSARGSWDQEVVLVWRTADGQVLATSGTYPDRTTALGAVTLTMNSFRMESVVLIGFSMIGAVVLSPPWGQAESCINETDDEEDDTYE